jgi:hypothetical protein
MAKDFMNEDGQHPTSMVCYKEHDREEDSTTPRAKI